MNKLDSVQTTTVGSAQIRVFQNKSELGQAAAADAARILNEATAQRGRARVIIATGPSQDEVIDSLVNGCAVDWSRITLFHMDEYIGIARHHAASFRNWLRTRVAERVRPHAVHYLDGDAADTAAECRRYAALLSEAPVDLCFVGFGENGHIAFNDPHLADFADPLLVKQVNLDTACRLQQVGEGHFPNLDAVPPAALTITIPAIMNARRLVCCVPDQRKARAVRDALQGPITPECPASIVRTHPLAAIYLDVLSASELAR